MVEDGSNLWDKVIVLKEGERGPHLTTSRGFNDINCTVSAFLLGLKM